MKSNGPFRERSVARVVGVDGCKGRWLAVALDATTGRVAASIQPTPRALLRAFPDAAVIALDVPIGLTDRGPRACDLAARRLLGRPRASSVFPAPIRAALRTPSRAEARRITEARDGRGVGCQAWNIYRHVRAWDALLRRDAAARGKVFEVHPEVCFFALNGEAPLRHGKKSPEGQRERRRLLEGAFGRAAVEAALADLAGERFGLDDFHDALAALWSARRIAQGEACSLPEQPPHDRCGLPMGIWY